tara:strand:+ start:4203 stop:7028 length:2826 start_codon:yes stop_codon:yes gene_type:complete
MQLGNLIKFVEKKYQKIIIKGICFDSRKVKKKYVFFAIDGNHVSGLKFANQAIAKGASAIISNKKIKFKNKKIPAIIVNDVRKSLSEACTRFYKRKPKNIIAVTGTNGKSSVVNFFYQILNFNKIPAASIGTLGVVSKNYKKKTNLTSMDPISLHKNLEILAKNKVNHIALEASSHGLDQKRLDNLNIKTGIFTNFSHDHLDYHKSLNSYFNAKMYLFRNLLKKNSTIIVDEDDKKFKTLKNISNKRKIKKITLGSKTGNLKILRSTYEKNNQIIEISYEKKITKVKIPLIGHFQIKNLLMAVIAAKNCGINYNKILNKIAKIKPVPGRLECVANLQNNSNIIVDFAHTPDALKQSLSALRKHFKKKIIIVFGCGGERDKKKRFTMGKIAQQYCRKIFITDDNPRNENPKKIRSEILKGCKKKGIDIGSRKKAIKTAIDNLESREVLLVAGKGHEENQDYGKKVINFSDKKVIKEILKKNSYKNFLAKKSFNNRFEKVNYNNVSINSKTIKKNDLFFSIRGKKTDGHKYALEALKKGASKIVVSKKVKKIPNKKVIKVEDTLLTLNNLANETRNKTYAKIIGITGSAGKTTLKHLIGSILKNYGKVYHSPFSYNNKFGVPLSLSNLKKNVKYGIFEIGMDKKGEINKLSKIVKPEIAIITNISEAHFKNFKTLKDIAKAKSEIIDNVAEGGSLILNKDDKFFNFLSKKAINKGINVFSFSSKKQADICLLKVKKEKNNLQLKIKVKNKIFYFNAKYLNNNFISNILACISVLYVLNLDLNYVKKAFIGFKIPTGRGDLSIVKKFGKKFKFIDESYNASPSSMSLAIKNMKYYRKKNNSRKFIFLGDMLELGNKSKIFHKKLSSIINKSDIDKVFVYGRDIKTTFNYLHTGKMGKIFNNLDEAYIYLGKILKNNDLLMIKGSNATGLNQFSKNIKKEQISAL